MVSSRCNNSLTFSSYVFLIKIARNRLIKGFTQVIIGIAIQMEKTNYFLLNSILICVRARTRVYVASNFPFFNSRC